MRGRNIKILLVGAGSSFSTKDVEMGYYEALKSLGVEVYPYALDKRLATASAWLKYSWRKNFNLDPGRKPSWADVVYRGSIEALEMALRFDVDWVVVISAMYFHPDSMIMARRANRKICVILTESPYQDKEQEKVARYSNLVFTNERTSVDTLRQVNPNTHYLRHAYSTARHFAGNEVSGSGGGSDVLFVGTGFQERIDLLSAVDWVNEGIDLGLYGTWTLLPPKHKLRKFIYGSILNNSDTLELYRRSKIGLNLHRSSKAYNKNPERISGAESLNPRAYELAASGTFCLTDYREEGEEVFGDTQPVFNGPDDLKEKIRFYVDHPSERRRLAFAAQQRVMGNTFEERAKEVLEKLDEC